MKKEVELIAFCGGDRTARNILDAVGQSSPVLGIPSGVKIYSSVFATNPTTTAASAIALLHDRAPTRLGEVVDVDEEAFRNNRLSVKLFGYLSTPDSGSMIQSSKSMTQSSDEEQLDAVADHVFELITPETTYVLGPGLTVARIAKRLGVPKTPLGVDVVKGDGTILVGTWTSRLSPVLSERGPQRSSFLR